MLLLATVSAAAPALQAGVYDTLTLGVDPGTGVVTGALHDETGAGQFSCVFALAGTPKDGVAALSTQMPGEDAPIRGTLTVAEGAVTLHLDAEHGGCWNVQHFADEPVKLTLAQARPYVGARLVAAKRAWLHATPTSARHGYLVDGDVVGVLAVDGAWTQVEYQGATTGWVETKDLAPPPPPPT